ncbi:MAG: hypothetical protein L0Z62_33625 [Gemmataceae bacterium]|nr:hypothetical protein [Gemmataceae bacterium]
MTCARRSLVLLAVLLCSVSGCLHRRTAGEVAPEPPVRPAATQGRLLNTGAIQLGPGVGQNAWRWQGDGQWGF